MATKVVMEALSPTMEEGRLVKWLKNEGDRIAKGDVLAEVETDKAVMELVARGEGVLRKRLTSEGDTSPVGTLLAVIAAPDENIDALVGGTGGSAPAAPAPPAAAASGGTSKPAEQVVARADERAGAGTSSIPNAPHESQGEASMPLQEQSRDATPEASQADGVNGAPPRQPSVRDAAPAAQPPHGANGERQRSSPLARRLASERGLNLDQLSGSGPGGRIIKRDIEAAVQSGAAAAAAPSQGRAPAPTPRPPMEGDFRDVPLTQIRKTIAKRLAESIGPIPTYYLTAEIDMERVAEMRAAMAALGEEFKVSYNDVLLKAVATALAQHPEVNAHWLGDKIRQFGRVHIGMAVAIEDGLITPVVFDADRKRMSEIAREARELAKRGRERKLKPEEYTGSTFSVSNLGMFGIDQFTAIINPPEVGILAVGALEEKPVVVDGAVTVRKRLRLTMSCDHRAVDGATGAKFLQTLRRLLENPLMLVY